jgi:hypothetical protein
MFNKIIYNPRLTLSYIYAGSLCLLYTNGCYVFITNNNEDITIAKKYKYVANGFTNFMVVDDKGRHFNVNNNFWHWKWDSIEDWTNINVNNKIRVSYYGIRLPFLGLFPNIVALNDTREYKKVNVIYPIFK